MYNGVRRCLLCWFVSGCCVFNRHEQKQADTNKLLQTYANEHHKPIKLHIRQGTHAQTNTQNKCITGGAGGRTDRAAAERRSVSLYVHVHVHAHVHVHVHVGAGAGVGAGYSIV